jgi:hypothetical protein
MKAVATLLAVTALFALSLVARADEKKEVTLKGTILCAKCVLKETSKCQTAIKVKEDGKDVVYYLDDKGAAEDYHENVCGGDTAQGTVVGVVTEKDGKKWIKPSKVEYAKKDK